MEMKVKQEEVVKDTSKRMVIQCSACAELTWHMSCPLFVPSLLSHVFVPILFIVATLMATHLQLERGAALLGNSHIPFPSTFCGGAMARQTRYHECKTNFWKVWTRCGNMKG